MIWLKGLFLLCLCVALGYVSLAYRLGRVSPSDFLDATNFFDGERETPPKKWQVAHSDYWIKLSHQALSEGSSELAENYALTALSQDITSGRAAGQLLVIYQQQNKQASAEAMADLAGKLAPVQVYVHAYLNDFRIQQKDDVAILKEWNILLSQNLGYYRPYFFPKLLRLVENPNGFPFLMPYINKPPTWWNSFFSYVTKNSQNLESIAKLYLARVNASTSLDKNSTSLSKEEEANYSARLLKEKQWKLAYQTWVKTLSEEQKLHLSYIYDGGFEDKKRQGLFAWYFQRHPNIRIQTKKTAGMTGERALLVTIHGRKALAFKHVVQRLLLPPGIYSLSFRYRPDRFKARNNEGLAWRIRCINEQYSLVGESQTITKAKGRTSWKTKEAAFFIPDNDCPAQILRLEASSPYQGDQRFQGRLWFDDMTISKTSLSTEKRTMQWER